MKIKQTIFLIIITVALSGCQLIGNIFEYTKTTEDFVNTLIEEDYDKCLENFALEHETAVNTDLDALKSGLENFRRVIVNDFGKELSYSFMKSEKTFSTVEENNTPPNTTVVQIEFSNGKEFGVLQVLFDDTSQKILNINTLKIKKPVPSMAMFWIFGFLAILILIFNVCIIIKVKKSNLNRKWLKYTAIMFLNVPAFSYAPVNGFAFKLLSFQVLFGISFSYMGYLGSVWTFGLPIGGIYWLWKLRQHKNSEQAEEITIQQINTKNTTDA